MSPIPELEPIREDATLNATEFVAALQAMAAEAEKAAKAMDDLFASIAATQKLMDSVAAGAAEAAAAETKLADAEARVGEAGAGAAAGTSAAADAAARLGAESAAAAAGESALAADLSATARAASAAALAESALVFADAEAAKAALTLAAAQAVLAGVSDTAGAAAAGAGRGIGVQIGWLRLGAANWATFLHWVVAGSAEFLAVAIPAAIALGAGLAVAAQGAQNAQAHFSALYAATESTYAAFHQTVGSVLGLHSALQNAQNAANPGVYEVLGSVINDLRGRTGALAQAGLDVVHNFDEFAARVSVDLKQGLGTEIQGLLSAMVTTLQQFGQVLGNLGHALLNFAAAMPGLAHVLLNVAVGLSTVIEWASRAGVLLTFAMGLEELYRWGGLALGVLARLAGAGALMTTFQDGGGFIAHFGAAIKALVVQAGVGINVLGEWIGKLGVFGAASEEAGVAVEAFGTDVAVAGAAMSTGMVAGVFAAAAALTFLTVKLMQTKTATQQWVDSSNQMVAKASDLNVLPTIYSQLAATATRLAAAQGGVAVTGNTTAQAIARQNQAAGMLATGTSDLAQHLDTLVATANTVRGNVSLLAGVFHTSQIGALALANAAGINLQVGLTKGSEAAKIAVQQITNLKTGLGAMGAPATEIGADMQAIGVQSQLASSKVSQVNQAMDAFIASTTGGMNQVMQFNAALRLMGHDGAASSTSIDGAIRSISASAAKMGFTLQGIGPKAQQSWQQFDAAVQQGNSVLDTFRVGMAEGVVTQQQYANEIRAVGGSLLPFAAHSQTARAIVSQLAQEMGGPATTNLKALAAQFGVTGRQAQNMATTGMEQAVARMANLNTVARNLSATISGQLDSAMASAIVSASGLDQKYKQWAADVIGNKAPQTLSRDLAAIRNAQNSVNTVEQKATNLLNSNKTAAVGYGGALKGAATANNDLGSAAKKSGDALAIHAGAAKLAAINAQGFGQQAHTAAGSATGLSSSATQATGQVRALGSASTVTRGSLGTVNNEIRNTASAASGSAGPLGSMAGNIRNVGGAASAAAGQVRSLEGAIAALSSKTVTVTTNVVTVTSTVHRAAGGPVFPGVPTVVGESGSEMYVPAVPGYIFNHAQTEQMMAGAGAKTGMTAASGQPVHMEATIPVTVILDGKPIFESVQRRSWQWSNRNTGRPGSWVPSGP